MSADRELLALAAKAIGATEYGGCDDCRPPGVVLLRGVPTHYEGRGEFGYAWNPRDDDGDGARLEAKLDLSVLWHYDMVAVSYRSALNVRENFAEYFADHSGDKQAARRLAGVRAAAEIGKAMP